MNNFKKRNDYIEKNILPHIVPHGIPGGKIYSSKHPQG